MQESVNFIKSKLSELNAIPNIGLVLGSGLGDIADEIEGIKIPYSEIPGFRASTVTGHSGNLVIGKLNTKTVIAMQGRLHFYEGYSISEVIYPVRVMKALGISTLILTNAAGGINKNFNPGDLMIIVDHINLMGNNPLIGKNLNELGPRFVDLTYAYDKELVKLTENTAKDLNTPTQKGVYIAVTGPTYETPAEIRMLRTLGADAVGMSTVPEVIAANHMGLKVLGISCITNMAAGILDQPLNHDEVIETSRKTKQNFTKLIKTVIERI
ncbi:MAG: purine-nucleoside phosphorylase [Candidatus Melainabacteria bacterium RIFOXYA12_FULL_32_12]|nr:MAG: purine-nucleoside phosphorylase [Candidatus Melainabacteria bacterium RIFOXYA2_FULL_32_9]OGI28109.1 MAG: purine-nucleoside phosphorylase [Candidatus Melainabacteria bacterium RIFOXYA12_FULL_32_12]